MEGATQFEMDLNTGLTQVLADGTNTHLYGNGRIGQFTGVDSAYFLGDALGSVRQLVNGSGDETMSRNYTPYGEVMNITGGRTSSFGFTNEYTSQGLIYLRARWYSPYEGRFLSADMWEGDFQSPMSYNVWLYVSGNPVIYSDPTGLSPAFTRIPEFEDVYNEKEKPGGVSFVPISDPLRKGAGGLEVKDGAQYYLGDENTGLCGLTSLTAVLYSVDGSITAEEVVTDYIDNTWVLDKGSNQVFHGNPNYISLEALKRYFQKSKYIRNVYGHWSAMWQKTYDDLPTSKLSGWLASGEILIAGVEISGTGKLISSQKTRDRYEQVTDYWGKYYDLKREGNSEEVIKSQIGTQPALCQKGSGGICHFVVITGVSSNWFDIYSDRNWVRIYNPYDNQTEYYKWKDFSASRSNIAGQVLRLAFHRNEKYCREGGVCMR